MKKSNFLLERLPFYKMGFLSFLLTFLFIAALQSNTEAQVITTINAGTQQQNGTNPRVLYAIPTGAFVPSATAQERITNALIALKGQLAQYAEGTAPYEAAFIRYTYYNAILQNLKDGKEVAESISTSLGSITGTTTVYPTSVTPEQALAEKNAAINLLR
jgi:hypothetical protein